jgi:allophanate hydrolase
VPAALSNTVGLKPSLGLVSNAGVVPACRTLDCVCLHALTVDDAFAALGVIAGPDPADAYSRPHRLGALGAMPSPLRLGVPMPEQRIFFGDDAAAAAYADALARLARLGTNIVPVDMAPFSEAARFLYEGPWVAERTLAARAVMEKAPQEMHPVTLQILLAGAKISAADAFAAFYRLEELRRGCDATFRAIDVMALPTVPAVHTIDQARADPIALNSRLGTYTNFVNMLELCAPRGRHAARRRHAVRHHADRARRRGASPSPGRAFHAATALPLGATGALHLPLRRRRRGQW